ncbi:glycoside hydrolase family 25 protein [Palleronia sediminis]|uniref:glycoside hydrolase family 25 protein n=1 Tax=Palleronia sediminis TaxID=2547833 RepID=UPI00351A5CF6
MTRFPAICALSALLALAACGGGRTVGLPSPDIGAATVTRADFGDSDPTDWGGPGPAAYAVHGIDLSKFQSRVDWRRARAAGVNFAFIKATEGGDRLDPYFAENFRGATEAGIAPGAYHFYYFCTDAERQARWFIENVPRTPGAMPPVVDLEWNPFSPTCTYRPPAEEVRAEVTKFMDIIARHYGQRPIIYTTPDFWERNEIARLGGETWLRAVAETPDKVYPGARWTFWQYTGTGIIDGIAGPVDINVFAGSPAEWRAWRAARAI